MNYWILFLILTPLIVGLICACETDCGACFGLGAVCSLTIFFASLSKTDKPTGNYSAPIPIERLIIEKGEFSAMIHVKNETGTIIQSIRVSDAADLNAFKLNNWQIKSVERRNWFYPSYYESLKFYKIEVEK